MLERFKKNKISFESMKFVLGGVTPEEYCATNQMIMQSCYNSGDLECVANAGAAWRANCAPPQA